MPNMDAIVSLVTVLFLVCGVLGGSIGAHPAAADDEVPTRTTLAPTDYWQAVLPETPMPKAIHDLLTHQSAAKEDSRKVTTSYAIQSENDQRKRTMPYGSQVEGDQRKTTISYWSKGENEQKKVTTSYAFHGEDSRKVTLSYGSQGEKDSSRKVTTSYGYQGDDSRKVTTSYESQDEEDSRKVTTSYGSQGEDTRKVTTSYGSEGGENSRKVTMSYGSQGADSRKVTASYGYEGGDDSRKVTTSYGSQGDDSRKVTTSYGSEGGQYLREVTTSYGSEGGEDSRKATMSYGSQGEDSRKVTTSYGSKGDEESRKVTMSYASQGEDLRKITKTYGYQGKERLRKIITSSDQYHGEDDARKVTTSYGAEREKDSKKVTISYGSPQTEELGTTMPSDKQSETIKGNMHDHIHSQRNNNDNKLADVFFFQEDLRPGSVITPTIPPTTSMPSMLPPRQADELPFTTKRFVDILAMFAPTSHAMAKEIWWTLDTCEHPQSLPGEKAACATSLESLARLPTTLLGTRNVRAFSGDMPTDPVGTPAKRGRYNVTSVRKLSTSLTVATCHDLTYPYVVFYCHTTNPAATYQVTMATQDDSAPPAMEVLAVCHLDTSLWSPRHPFLVAHNLKPGDAIVCHFLSKLSIVWVPIDDNEGVRETQ